MLKIDTRISDFYLNWLVAVDRTKRPKFSRRKIGIGDNLRSGEGRGEITGMGFVICVW